MKESYFKRLDATSMAKVVPVMAQLDTCQAIDESLPGSVHITRVIVPEKYRNKGHGTALMNEILVDADSENRVLTVAPSAYDSKDQNSLVDWYERFAFVESPSGLMVREPNTFLAFKLLLSVTDRENKPLLFSLLMATLGGYTTTYIPGEKTYPAIAKSKLFVWRTERDAIAYSSDRHDTLWKCVCPKLGCKDYSARLIPWPSSKNIVDYWRGHFDVLARNNISCQRGTLLVDWVQLTKQIRQ